MKKYLYKDKKAIVLNCIISILGFVCLIGMFYSYSLITDVVIKKDINEAHRITFNVFGFIFALMLCMIFSTFITRRILKNAVFSLREDIFRRAYNKNLENFKAKGTNYFASVLFNDVDMIEDKYFRPMLEIVNDVMQIIMMSIVLCMIGIRYFIVVFLLILPTIMAPLLLKNKMVEQGKKLSKGLEIYTGLIRDTLGNFYIAKYFEKEDKVVKRFKYGTECIEEQKYKLSKLKAYNICVNSLIVLLFKYVSLFYFSNSALRLLIDVATVSMLFSVTNNIGNPIHNILGYFESINSTKSIRDKIEELIKYDEKINQEFSIVPKNNDIKISDLTLELNKINILNSFSFSFEQGKKYAVLGESGSGKSSFLKVILGYFNDYGGKITVGGINIKEIEKYQLYKKIVYISQDTYIFTDTLRNNITLLSNKFTDRQIMRAIKKAKLDDLIERLDAGLDTVIDSDKISLSGGERQRIALARAFLFDANIYILDEATAALDLNTTDWIENQILALKDKIVISVIHKIDDNINKYDSVLIVKEGKVIVADTYNRLVEMYPEYALLLWEGACVNNVCS